MRRGIIALCLAVGCTSAPPIETPDASIVCTDHAQCDDGLFCNGEERCMPFLEGASARGCAPAAEPEPCLAGQTCDEGSDRCVTDCVLADDADGDGHRAIDCGGGDDCDDADALRFPGNVEICDEGNHDEDCDDTTYGERNGDRDGADDLRCCNVRDDDPTMLNCGEDCDDLRRVVNPDTTEACDRFDNDCDGAIDEGVFVEVYADADRDGVGAGTPTMRCADAVGFALEGDDCDDADPAQRPRGPEICDARDNDCDGEVDEMATAVTWYRDADGDGLGSPRTGTVTSCEPLTGFSLLGNDCDDTRRGVSPVANELCNGVDDDCNGVADFEVRPGDLEDDDGDGFLDVGCGAAGDDCDDAAAATHPGATEVCDGRDNDCDGTSDDLTGMIAWYVDRDGDGWGDGSVEPITQCTEPAGRVTRALDCDDSDPDRHPGRADLCDGEEEDCDTEIDEDAARVRYWTGDRDGDGYAGGAPVESCMAVAGATTVGGDCDDDREDLRPGATETCDGEDDDCDGETDEALGTVSCGLAACRVTVPACSGGAAPVCTPGTAMTELCNGTDDDCDGGADDEPEASAACALANAIDQCRSGACVVAACVTGFGDCDRASANGCESDHSSDEASCGSCGHACPPGRSCTAGLCEGEIAEVALGARHSCARTADGAVYCWGDNGTGQIGINSGAPRVLTASRVVWADGSGATPALDRAYDLDVGRNAACVTRFHGVPSYRVICWGAGREAGLNLAPTSIVPRGQTSGYNFFEQPQGVEFQTDVHFVQESSGRLVWAGIFAESQAGDGNGSGSAIGYAGGAAGGQVVSRYACGGSHCLGWAPLSSTLSYVWGRNQRAQIDAASGDAATPRSVDHGAWDRATGGAAHSCVVRPTGVVACMGDDTRGQAGLGATSTSTRRLTENGVDGSLGIDAHADTTCAIDAMGMVRCWGACDFGQCGRAGPADAPTPVLVDLGGVRARAIGVGDRHACAVLVTNQVVCWGQNAFGQLGDGSLVDSSAPVFVTGLP